MFSAAKANQRAKPRAEANYRTGNKKRRTLRKSNGETTLFLGPTNAIWTVRVFDKVLSPNRHLYAQNTTCFSITLQQNITWWTWRYKNSHMAQLTIEHSNTQHYVKMLCTTTTKPPPTSKFYVDFKKTFFQRSINWNTPSYLQMFCAFSGRSLSWNTTVFSRFTSREHANFIGCHFFHTHVLPHHSKAQLLRYCVKRSFLGVAKSWKVTLSVIVSLGLSATLKIWLTSSYIQFWLWPGLPCKGIREINPDIVACGIWKFRVWNPGYSSRNPESHWRLKFRIQVPVK